MVDLFRVLKRRELLWPRSVHRVRMFEGHHVVYSTELRSFYRKAARLSIELWCNTRERTAGCPGSFRCPFFNGYGLAGNRGTSRIPGASYACRIAPSRLGLEHPRPYALGCNCLSGPSAGEFAEYREGKSSGHWFGYQRCFSNAQRRLKRGGKKIQPQIGSADGVGFLDNQLTPRVKSRACP